MRSIFFNLVYVEFGTAATDSVTLTNTWDSTGLSTPKTYNILARQIPCTATYKYDLKIIIKEVLRWTQ